MVEEQHMPLDAPINLANVTDRWEEESEILVFIFSIFFFTCEFFFFLSSKTN